MARSFLGFGQHNYIGIPIAQAIKLGGIATAVIPLQFNWLSYGAATANPNVNVLVDYDTKPCSSIDYVRSVYIDNLGSATPIYVYFPDTGYTVVAQPNSEGWYPAFTNARKIWVIGLGFLDGSIPTTNVMLSNLAQIPSVNVELPQAASLWKASPVITRGTSIYNSALGIPALGDQIFFTQLDLGVAGSNPILNSPLASGFYYITGIDVTLVGANAAGPLNTHIIIESLGVTGIIFDWIWRAQAIATYVGNFNLINMTGMNTKLSAIENYRIRNTVALGGTAFANLTVSYTASN